MLSDDQIKELLQWFINSSESYKKWVPRRRKYEKLNHQWIQPEVIKNLSDLELKGKYLDYFNSGTGEKQKIVAITRDRVINNKSFRKSLLYLLNEDIEIKTRINNLLDTKNENHIDGMGRALITAFLMDFKPDKYCLWNKKTEEGLNALRWDNFYDKKGDSAGDRYCKVLNLLKKLKNLDPELKLTYLDVDLFLHTIASEEEGKKILNSFLDKTKNDDKKLYSKKKQRIWKISLGSYEKRKKVWPKLVETGYIGVTWFLCEEYKKRSYSKFKSLEEIRQTLRECANKVFVGTSARMMWNFGTVMKKDDIIVVNNGQDGILGIGLINSDYIGPHDSNKPKFGEINQYYHFRKVKWLIRDEIELNNIFFDMKTITELNKSKWHEIKSFYLTKDSSLINVFEEIEKVIPRVKNIRNSLKDILNNYKLAKENKIAPNQIQRIRDEIEIQLPNYLIEQTDDQYVVYSNIRDIFPDCPFVALMNEKITIRPNDGFFINYMLRKDMSGVYLSLRLGIDDSANKEGYENALRTKSEELRNKIEISEMSSLFSNTIDLKSENDLATFYEAGNIYSKFYEAENLPTEEELKEDLRDLLDIYDALAENEFLKFLKKIYTDEMEIALGELERGKNIIFYGPPGSGKTVLAKIISEEYGESDPYSLYTVHSGTDYYDLVCRIVPQVDENGNLTYLKERRFLLDALLSGQVLILDEINRTQIDTALGIFFTYLERDHRINDAEHIQKILIKEIEEDIDIDTLKDHLSRFRIIGTLNIYDKTFLFKLGDALKRRFTFIEITTNNDLVEKLYYNEFQKDFIKICDYKGDLETAHKIINTFADLNKIKPLGIGILKDTLLFTSYFKDNAADLSISSLIVPFFENDLNYSYIKNILEKNEMKNSINRLKSLNFGTSDINGI